MHALKAIAKKKFIGLAIVIIAISSFIVTPANEAEAVSHGGYTRYNYLISDTHLKACQVSWVLGFDRLGRMWVIAEAKNRGCIVVAGIQHYPSTMNRMITKISPFGNIAGLTTNQPVSNNSTAYVHIRACAGGFGCGAFATVSSVRISAQGAINV